VVRVAHRGRQERLTHRGLAPDAIGTDPRSYWDAYLVSWVPPALLALAEKGVWANPVACLAWADEVAAPFVHRLRRAGLLG
jgi:hypothetical protein